VTVPPGLLDLIVDAVAERVAERLRPMLIAPTIEQEPWHLVGVDDVARALGRSRRWVHGAVKERGLPFIRLDGGALAFDLQDVQAWAESRRVPAADEDPLAVRLQASRDHALGAASNGRTRSRMQRAGS
jgi:predicted DNA-binding transcriptional regulator AlpA